MYLRSARLETSTISIEDLRISFRVEKSLIGYPNLATIRIYNLSESTRQEIKEEGLLVRLYAGYDTTPLLFSGDIINVIHRYEQPDWVTEIYGGDTFRSWNTSTINTTLTAGATQEQIYDTLVGSLIGVIKGITEGLTRCITGKRSLARTFQLSGSIKEGLRVLTEQ
jgi:hypothetical protein